MNIPHGQLIDAGFAVFAQAQGPLDPELALDLRIAFFAGAQHMFAAMVRLSRGQGGDRLSLSEIEAEIHRFAEECILRGAPCAGSA